MSRYSMFCRAHCRGFVLSVTVFFAASVAEARCAPQDRLCLDQPTPLALPDQSGRFLAPVFSDVAIDKDLFVAEVTNSAGSREKLLLDIYAPAEDRAARRPALLLIHGGGFKNGTKAQGYIVTLAMAMAKRGYVCVSTDYRQRPNPQLDWKGTLTDSLEDIQLGLRWMHSHAEAHRIDTGRIAVVGGSAGGMIAVNFVSRDSLPAGHRLGVFALVNLWGSPYRQELWPAAVDACYPPTLIIHGTKDESVPYEASTRLAGRLNSAGVRHTLLPLPDAPHTPTLHMEQIISAVSAFLHESLTGTRRNAPR